MTRVRRKFSLALASPLCLSLSLSGFQLRIESTLNSKRNQWGVVLGNYNDETGIVVTVSAFVLSVDELGIIHLIHFVYNVNEFNRDLITRDVCIKIIVRELKKETILTKEYRRTIRVKFTDGSFFF